MLWEMCAYIWQNKKNWCWHTNKKKSFALSYGVYFWLPFIITDIYINQISVETRKSRIKYTRHNKKHSIQVVQISIRSNRSFGAPVGCAVDVSNWSRNIRTFTAVHLNMSVCVVQSDYIYKGILVF